MSLSEKITLCVASVNVLHGVDLATGRVDIDAAAAAIAGLDPDVVALQEVDRGQARSAGVEQAAVVAAAMGGDARFAAALLGDPGRAWRPGVADDADRVGGEAATEPAYGLALVSRWPIRHARTQPLPGAGAGSRRAPPSSPTRPGWDREPRTALRAELDVGGRAITVTVVHLSYLPWRGLRQLRAVHRLAAPPAGQPALLVGDFNLPARAVRAVSRGWRHAGGGPTYPAWRPRAQPDQLLVRGPVAVEEARVGPRPPGDHLPLLARLRLR